MRGRRFYVFNSKKFVLKHISKIKTSEDLLQLRHDIRASETNLVRLESGTAGVYIMDCLLEEGSAFRHIFLTRSAFERLGNPPKDKADSFTVLEDVAQLRMANHG